MVPRQAEKADDAATERGRERVRASYDKDLKAAVAAQGEYLRKALHSLRWRDGSFGVIARRRCRQHALSELSVRAIESSQRSALKICSRICKSLPVRSSVPHRSNVVASPLIVTNRE
jgi:hypothetical protein